MGRKMGRRESPKSATAGDDFPAGAQVEVRSEDEGFRDAWYEATVTRAPRNRRGVYVVYDSIVNDKDPSKPLREFVRGSHVRPRPPRRLAAGSRYSVHQLVDAYHNDGWWGGVISAVHGGMPPDRYTVCFPTSREEIDFVPSELRPRLAWIEGQWRLSYDQAGEMAKFVVGESVEISGDRENYGAAWFSGTILKLISKTIFLVLYTTQKEDGGCELLSEILDAQYIRPPPPPPCLSMTHQFELHNEVEAFDRCGWFVAVVSEILDDSKYIVKFKYRKEVEMKFHHSKLRIRRDWILGRWYHASKDKVQRRASHVGKISSLPLSISTSSSSDESTYERPLKMLILKRNKIVGSSCEGQVEMLRSSKRGKGDSSDHLRIELSPKSPIAETDIHAALPNFESPSSVFIVAEFNSKAEESSSFKCDGYEQQSKAPNFNHSLQTIEWGSCKGVRLPRGNALRRRTKLVVRGPQRQREVVDVDVREHVKEGLKENGGSPTKKSMHSSVECMELPQLERPVGLVVENEQRMEGVDLSNGGVTDDVSNGILQLCFRDEVMSISDVMGDSPNSNLISNQADNHADKPEASHFTPQMESSARGDTADEYLVAPQLSTMISSSFSNGVREMSNGNGLSETGTEGEDQVPLPPLKDGSAVFISNTFNPGVQEMSNFGNGFSETGPEGEDQAPLPPLKDGSAVFISNTSKTSIQEVSSFRNQLNPSGKEAENMALPSSLVEGIAVTCKNHTSSGSPSKRASVEDRVFIDPPPKGSSSMKTRLPFAKRSSLWESVESMEVFRKIPQQPHFCQLEIYSEEFREGMAIGWMVSFANVVANIRKLRISDPQTSFEESMKALFPFEANGFDVQWLRSQMEKLLELRNNKIQSEVKEATMQGEIFERENEKDRLNALSAIFSEFIMELEQHVARIREERYSVVIQRENNESDIVRLQKDVQAVEERYLSAEQQFDAITAAPWRL